VFFLTVKNKINKKEDLRSVPTHLQIGKPVVK